MRCLPSLLLLTAIVAFASEPEPLFPGQSIVRKISGSDSQQFSITMQAGEQADLVLRHLGVDFTARLLNPDGSAAAEFSAPHRENEEEPAGFVALQTGAYQVEIHAPYRNSIGKYEIRLSGIRAATEHDRRMYEALTLGTESFRLSEQGQSAKAVPLAARAVEIFREELGEQNATVALWLSTLGRFQLKDGAYDKGIPLLEQALALQQTLRGTDHPETLTTLGFLGSAYRDTGDARAEPLLSRAFELTQKTLGSNHPSTADALLYLALLHYKRGDFQKAEDEYQRSLAIEEPAFGPEDQRVLLRLNDLAVLYNSRHQYARAEPLLERVLAHRSAFGADGADLALPLWNMGLIAQEYHRDDQRALDLYSRALAILEHSKDPDHPDIASVLNNMANVYKSLGDYSRALELHQRVHEMWLKSFGPYHSTAMLSLGNIARTYASMGDAENTIRFQALADEALEKNLELSLVIGSERQKLAYFDSVSERTDRTISYQVRLAPDSQPAVRMAALAALQRKGRVLDAMSLNLANLRERIDAPSRTLLDTWSNLITQFARLALNGPGPLSRADYRKSLTGLGEQRDRAEAELSRSSAEFQGQTQPVTLGGVQALIPPDAALIEFASWRAFDPGKEGAAAYGEPRYIAYVLRAGGSVGWKDLGPAKDLDRAVESFRKVLSDPGRLDVRAAARSLDRTLLEPLRALSAGARQLLIAPEGTLNLLPFQALVDQSGRYLVERYLITYLSSGRDLLRLQTPRLSRGAPVIIADPSFGESEAASVARAAAPLRSVTIGADWKDLYFAPLAGTGDEARAVRALFPDARVLSGSDATESALKRVQSPRILHIATHGFFLPASPGGAAENPLLRSGLALAGANRRSAGSANGIFTALEASGLNLWGTRLVTLSACDTGVGEVRIGEGVYGLRRAFVLAGAETLVMSLWPVSDSTTRQTMTVFYAGLKNGLGRGEALRQAQLAILKSKGREHPFYWASFIESGQWATLETRP